MRFHVSLTGPLEPSGLTMATATGAKSNRSDYRIKCVLEIRWIANSSHCSEPSDRDGRVRLKQLVSAAEEGGASRHDIINQNDFLCRREVRLDGQGLNVVENSRRRSPRCEARRPRACQSGPNQQRSCSPAN